MNNNNKYAKLNNSNKIYKVSRLTDKQAVLTDANTSLITSIDNIEFVNEKHIGNKQAKCSVTIESSNIPNEIMLRHLHKEDAISLLDKYIDQAIVAKIARIRIIHGKHGGVLRAAVHEYLSCHPFVKSFCIADYSEGGIGVTVAILGKK